MKSNKSRKEEVLELDLDRVIRSDEVKEKLRQLCEKEGVLYPDGVSGLIERYLAGGRFS